mmetsp:Transcript_84072/g.224879  ORF Transcript_84072/g.224879 Transcript_84072/m.224879 type:complete len:223 (-) Transcript_84072:108-776(-)
MNEFEEPSNSPRAIGEVDCTHSRPDNESLRRQPPILGRSHSCKLLTRKKDDFTNSNFARSLIVSRPGKETTAEDDDIYDCRSETFMRRSGSFTSHPDQIKNLLSPEPVLAHDWLPPPKSFRSSKVPKLFLFHILISSAQSESFPRGLESLVPEEYEQSMFESLFVAYESIPNAAPLSATSDPPERPEADPAASEIDTAAVNLSSTSIDGLGATPAGPASSTD